MSQNNEAGVSPLEHPVRPLVERLVNASRGYTEWRVQDKDGSYCISFDRSDCLDPEREARRWLNNHRKDYPEHKFSGYEVKAVTVYSQDDELKSEAACELQRLRGQLDVLGRWIAEALPALDVADALEDFEDGGEHLRMLKDRGQRLADAILRPNAGGKAHPEGVSP